MQSPRSDRRKGWFIGNDAQEREVVKQLVRSNVVESGRAPSNTAHNDANFITEKLEMLEDEAFHRASTRHAAIAESTFGATVSAPTRLRAPLLSAVATGNLLGANHPGSNGSLSPLASQTGIAANFAGLETRRQLKAAQSKAKFFEKRNKAMEAKMNALQAILNDLCDESGLRDVEESPTLQLEKIVFSFCVECGFLQSAKALSCELRLSSEQKSGILLKSYMRKRQFNEAAAFVRTVVADLNLQNQPVTQATNRLILAFEDLCYILTKYSYLTYTQSGKFALAQQLLESSLYALVHRETSRGGSRAGWFIRDFNMLRALLSADRNSKPDSSNIYINFSWKDELENFWKSAILVKKSPNSEGLRVPLYAHAVAQSFLDDLDDMSGSVSNNFGETSLAELLACERKLKRLTAQYNPFVEFSTPTDAAPTLNKVEEGSASLSANKKEPRLLLTRPFEERVRKEWADALPTEVSIDVPVKMLENEVLSVPGSNIVLRLPPLPDHVQSTLFQPVGAVGPAQGAIRALDVLYIKETGETIAATSGGDNRSSRLISIWNIITGSLIQNLNNVTSKNIVALLFHARLDAVLFSADMEFDIKLWNWRQGTLLKVWKKAHSRIINNILFVPGDDDRFATCSGDQSFKVWDIDAEPNSHVMHVNANEAIQSFSFTANHDMSQQKVVIALAYSIRVYKMRTMGLVLSLPFDHLKINKQPIWRITSHPLNDNFLLLSCETQFKLLDLESKSFVKAFVCRDIEAGVKVDGHFSPYGSFIYAGTSDCRLFSSSPPERHSGQSGRRLHLAASTSGESLHGVDQMGSAVKVSEAVGNEASFSGRASVVLWKTHTGKLDRFFVQGHSGQQCSVSLSRVLQVPKTVAEVDGDGDSTLLMVLAGSDKYLHVYSNNVADTHE